MFCSLSAPQEWEPTAEDEDGYESVFGDTGLAMLAQDDMFSGGKGKGGKGSMVPAKGKGKGSKDRDPEPLALEDLSEKEKVDAAIKKARGAASLLAKLIMECKEATTALSKTQFWNKQVKQDASLKLQTLENLDKNLKKAILGKPMSSDTWRTQLLSAAAAMKEVKEHIKEWKHIASKADGGVSVKSSKSKKA